MIGYINNILIFKKSISHAICWFGIKYSLKQFIKIFNNQKGVIYMGIIDSIKEAMRMGAEVGDRFDKFNVRSVARGASEQTMSFQALIDNTVAIDFASVTVKTLDRVYAEWTRIYLSSVGCIDLNYIKNPRQFIAQYQPQWNFECGKDEIDEYEKELQDNLYGDDFLMLSALNPERRITAAFLPSEYGGGKEMRQNLKDSMVPAFDGYNLGGIQNPMMEAPSAYDDINGSLSQLIDNEIDATAGKNHNDLLKIQKDIQVPKIGDTDIKKLNDMMPYTLELKLMASKGDSAFSEWINYVIGVKTSMHLANSDSLIRNIVYVLKNRNAFFNFILWTTGELSLVKDIMLHMDDINFEIANKADSTGRFCSSLKKMKRRYLKMGTFGINRLAPMATIVISSSTYYIIKNNYGFDLKNMVFAQKLMDELFLMCFVIIDDATRTVDMLVDGGRSFHTYALETLEREVTMTSNKLGKELTRMLGTN